MRNWKTVAVPPNNPLVTAIGTLDKSRRGIALVSEANYTPGTRGEAPERQGLRLGLRTLVDLGAAVATNFESEDC